MHGFMTTEIEWEWQQMGSNNEPQNYSDLISVGGQTFHPQLVEQVTWYKDFIYIFYYQ